MGLTIQAFHLRGKAAPLAYGQATEGHRCELLEAKPTEAGDIPKPGKEIQGDHNGAPAVSPTSTDMTRSPRVIE